MNNKDNLYGWIFTFNPYTNNWHATTRDNYFLLFSNNNNENVLKSSSIKTLEEIIRKTAGDKEKIKNLIN